MKSDKVMATMAIVDGHALTRKTLVCRFSSLGYNVVLEAETGKDFINNMQAHPAPDICLLGINRPVQAGIETALRLKEKWPGIKILFFSMPTSGVHADMLMKIGIHGFVSKNAPFADLNNALLNIIKERQPAPMDYLRERLHGG